MKPNNQLIQVAIKFGLIGSLMNVLALMVLFSIGKHPLLLNPIFDPRLSLYGLFIFAGLKTLKDQNGRVLHFWQGIFLGFLIYLIMAQMVAAFIAVFASIEGTHFLSSYIAIAIEQLDANKTDFVKRIGEKEFYNQIRMLPNTTATVLAFDYFLKSMPIGLILTLILSIIMRRKEKAN